ncbi:MAG: hypothetical protein K6G12_02525 [Lachnospiraceae bacterium]|nr:hypothetical protein [Lachnospiraceae bacterium]
MGIGSALSGMGSSAKGMFTDGSGSKAIIYIPNPDVFDPDLSSDDTRKAQEKLNQEAAKLEKQLNKKNGISYEPDNDVADLAKDKLSMGANLMSGLKSTFTPGGSSPDKVAKPARENSNFVKVEFQFNPDSIRMDSINGKIQDMNGSETSSKMISKKTFVGRTKLSFDVTFDDLDLMDAFMLQEVVNLNVTNAANKGINMFTHGGNTFSVTAKMEAFMSLLASANTQHVIFYWGKLCFRGQVTGVTNKYTMFNTSGNPIRGTMHLEITQDGKTNDKYEYDMQAWKNSFDKCFKNGSGGGRSMASKFLNNNVLNF